MAEKYVFVQEKGQKKYGPPPDWYGPPPPKGCEVFIGKLPRYVFEEELMRLFSTVGRIYEFRLMVDFSTSTRGFAFATYTNKEDAAKAVRALNNYPIRCNRFIGVVPSIDNTRIFVGGIPHTVTRDMALKEFKQLTEGVVGVEMNQNAMEPGKNRGFVFVEYETHRAASKARRILFSDDCLVFGRKVNVEWEDRTSDLVDYNTLKILYVKSIPAKVKNEVLFEIFSANGVFGIERIRRIKNSAFIHYFIRRDAECVLAKVNGLVWNGWIVEVTWAKLYPFNKRTTTAYDRNNANDTRNTGPFDFQFPAQQTRPLTSNPVQMLSDICLSNGWGMPVYNHHVTEASVSNPFATHSVKVYIPNIPYVEKQFTPPGYFFSPSEAQCCSALFVLTKLGFIDSGCNALKYNSLEQMDRKRSIWSQDDFEAKVKAALPLMQSPGPLSTSNLRLNADPLNLLAVAASLVNENIQSKNDNSIFY